jgi:hypothetical protein
VRISDHVQLAEKIYSSVGRPTGGGGELNLYIKHRTKYQTMAIIQDTQVAELWTRKLVVPEKCGQL